MITIIVAIAKNNVIGKSNDLPWYLPEDLKRFRALTENQTVIMGRKTYESILKRRGSPLPNRKNVVITRQTEYEVPEGVEVFASLDVALLVHTEDVFIIGGAEIYKQAMDKTDRLLITEVAGEHDGDVFFPTIDTEIWKETTREVHDGYSYVNYERK